MWERQGEISEPILASEDAQEGSKAFAEKRDPQWRGVEPYVVSPSALNAGSSASYSAENTGRWRS